ncbi:drim domain-containing protein [Fagus crenata]
MNYYNRSRGQQQQLQRLMKVGMGLLGLCLVGYIVGPPLYYLLSESFTTAADRHVSSSSSACPICHCDCSSQPLFSLPDGWSNMTVTDCMKHDPDVSEEAEQGFIDLLSEELKLKEAEAQENQRRADMALLEAKKKSSQYQKEADKCNSGMDTCEEAREKAESALEAQKNLTAMWQQRAIQRGWKEPRVKLRAHV